MEELIRQLMDAEHSLAEAGGVFLVSLVVSLIVVIIIERFVITDTQRRRRK